MYIQINTTKIHFVSGSIRLQGYNVHTNKSNENTFCPAQSGSEVTMYTQIKATKIHFVRLNPAPKLQCTLQNTIYKANENEILYM